MKTTAKLHYVLGIVAIAILGITLSSFSAKTTSNPTIIAQINDANVSITITSTTTQEEFEDIMDMLKEHNIEGSFTNFKRNDLGEITGIKIVLKDISTGNKSSSNMQSSTPIGEISFGRKDKALYITQGKNGGFGNFAFLGQGMGRHFNMDSIFGNRFIMMDSLRNNMFNFNDEDGNIFMFNGKSFEMDDMMDSFQDLITIEEDENGQKRIIIKGGQSGGLNFFFDSDDEDSNWTSKPSQKFKFYDDPNTEKIILIDGKEASFDKLNELAKADRLDSVDVLKGKTAISIYGDKAKDGAIIATTKQ